MRCRASSLGLCLLGLALLPAAPAPASVDIGRLAPSTTGAGSCAGSDYAQLHVAGGQSNYSMPETGTIISWSHNAASGGAQQLTMKVLRQVGDPHLYDYQVIGLDGPRDLTPGEINTFPTEIPVRALDILDLNAANGATACTFPDDPLDTILTRTGFLTLGQTGTFSPTVDGSHLNLAAVLEPSNAIAVGAITRDKKEGTATLNVTIPNPGDLSTFGKGVAGFSAGGARASSFYGLPGLVHVPIAATGKQKRTLNRTGRVKLKVRLAYTPVNGSLGIQSTTVRLKKKR